jgi:hypothetical protein
MNNRNVDGLPTPRGGDDAEEVLCVDCRKPAPRTRTSHSLISSPHGWRLRRTTDGPSESIEWLCPRCWDAWKSKAQALRET